MRSNLFLIALDQLDLAARGACVAAEVHRRASEWCLGQGLLEEGLEYAYGAGDDRRLADLLVEYHNELMRTGRQSTLLRWVGKLPTERLLEYPTLPLATALAVGLSGGNALERRRFVGLAHRARKESPASWSSYHEGGLGLAETIWVDGDLTGAVTAGRRAVEVSREHDDLTVAALGNLAFLLVLSGEFAEARTTAQEAIDRPEAADRPNGLVYALAALSLAATESGDALEAESVARTAISTAAKANAAHLGSTGAARVALARALAVAGRLREAEQEAVAGERLRRQPDPEASHIHALLVLAEIRAHRGKLPLARQDLAAARRALGGFADAGTLISQAARVDRAINETDTDVLQELPSPAELQVLRLLAGDLSQRKIGSKLFLSMNTVKTHTRALYRKLGAVSRDDAVRRATALGLLGEDHSPGKRP